MFKMQRIIVNLLNLKLESGLNCLDLRVFVEFVEGAVTVPLEPGAVALLPPRHLRRDVLRQPGPVRGLARPAAEILLSF